MRLTKASCACLSLGYPQRPVPGSALNTHNAETGNRLPVSPYDLSAFADQHRQEWQGNRGSLSRAGAMMGVSGAGSNQRSYSDGAAAAAASSADSGTAESRTEERIRKRREGIQRRNTASAQEWGWLDGEGEGDAGEEKDEAERPSSSMSGMSAVFPGGEMSDAELWASATTSIPAGTRPPRHTSPQETRRRAQGARHASSAGRERPAARSRPAAASSPTGSNSTADSELSRGGESPLVAVQVAAQASFVDELPSGGGKGPPSRPWSGRAGNSSAKPLRPSSAPQSGRGGRAGHARGRGGSPQSARGRAPPEPQAPAVPSFEKESKQADAMATRNKANASQREAERQSRQRIAAPAPSPPPTAQAQVSPRTNSIRAKTIRSARPSSARTLRDSGPAEAVRGFGAALSALRPSSGGRAGRQGAGPQANRGGGRPDSAGSLRPSPSAGARPSSAGNFIMSDALRKVRLSPPPPSSLRLPLTLLV